MVLHLEAGTCKSGSDLDMVLRVATECSELYEWVTERGYHEFSSVQCPTCDNEFSKMSAILQHAESEICEEDPAEGPLGEFLDDLRKAANELCGTTSSSESSCSSW